VNAPATFTKRDPQAPVGFFEAEARGLRWLAQADGGVPVVGVRRVEHGQIVLDRLDAVSPSRAQAIQFGRRMARTHGAGCSVWGRDDGDGYIGALPLPNGPYASFADLWWSGRIEPYLRRAVDGRLLTREDAHAVERVVAARSPEASVAAPSRVHGDLWSGNVVWTASGAVLIDGAAAHGGHPEADLAMLSLFGLPHLREVLEAYQDSTPIPAGWQQRVPFFWLHPLLVHVVLFGGGYVEQVRRAVAALA